MNEWLWRPLGRVLFATALTVPVPSFGAQGSPIAVTVGVQVGSGQAIEQAQVPPSPGQGLATVSGTVSNESGRRLEHALVTLDPEGGARQVRTDAEGRYSFIGVPIGRHVVRATWVGFVPESRGIDVAGGAVTVDFALRRITVLDTVAVRARRTGVYGTVVSKDSLLPVPGARIEVIGARRADSTDSSGAFVLSDIKPGTYVVRVKHALFQSRNFGITVPTGGAAELDVVVERGRVSRDQHMEGLYREMDSRLNARGINTAFVTRDELRGREKMALDVAISFTPEVQKRSLFISTDVCLFVDGIARPGAMIQDFAPEDIESIELYAAPYSSIQRNAQGALGQADPTGSLRNRWPPRAPCGQLPTPSKNRVAQSAVKVMFAAIWLKK